MTQGNLKTSSKMIHKIRNELSEKYRYLIGQITNTHQGDQVKLRCA